MDAVGLRALQHRLPNVTTALAEIAHLQAVRTLPRPTSLRNGSGSLRPVVERTSAGTLSRQQRATLLQLIYYPREAFHLRSLAVYALDLGDRGPRIDRVIDALKRQR
ncbi:MAG TPA: hypothetical protein VH054_04745, partial [Polyangiaceae bacterium]|nr:hypothetical protein [Polyangiaceae bacterium]